MNEDCDMAYFMLADNYEVTGYYEKSIANYQKAIQINPKNDLAYYGLGYTYSEQGDS